jgi:aminopeptidase N
MFERAGQAVLYHPSEHVREMALLALNGTIEAINYPYPDEEQPGLVDHDNRARDVLLHVLQHDPSAYIRHSALSCLLYIRDPQTWDRVVQTARNDSSLDVQEYLYLKLVDYANDPFYETNMEYVRDPEDLRRVLEHRRQESLRVLKETLEMHPDSGMRQTIKECLEESQ